jgi:hypothetical protein
MKTRTQTVIGVALLAAAPVAAGVLYALGIRLVSADFQALPTTPGSRWSGGWVGHFNFHWSMALLLIVALLGLWLLVRSKQDKPTA